METAPQITLADTANTIQPLQIDAVNLIEQAIRAVIDSEESAEAGVDLKKLLANHRKKMEEARTKLVKPLNDHVKMINVEFKPKVAAIEEAERSISAKVLSFKQEQDRIAREAEAKRRKEIEDEALRQAEAAQESGDEEMAETIVNLAAAIPETTNKPDVSRGGYTGAAGSIRKTWNFSITDKALVPDQFKVVDDTAIRAVLAESRKVFEERARANGLKGEAVKLDVDKNLAALSIPGVKIYQKEDLNVR